MKVPLRLIAFHRSQHLELLGCFDAFVHQGAGGRRQRIHDTRQKGETEFQGCEVLPCAIVQIPSDAPPLVILNVNQRRSQFVQFIEHALALSIDQFALAHVVDNREGERLAAGVEARDVHLRAKRRAVVEPLMSPFEAPGAALPRPRAPPRGGAKRRRTADIR
jgi:hypothetical protein